MIVVIKIKTKGGGNREVELPATSVEDARKSVQDFYHGCKIIFAKIKNGDKNERIIRSDQTETG